MNVTPPRRRANIVAACWCAAMAIVLGVWSTRAALTKSATYDEPMHALAGIVHRDAGDFRINFEDPPLWQYWCAIPNRPGAMKIDYAKPSWQGMTQDPAQEWAFTVDTLYRTPGNDGAAIVNRSRVMMAIVGIALAGMTALWAWQLANPLAACVATTLLCLDPNFLGHSALVKNDVAMSLVMVTLMYFVWRIGRRATWANVMAASLIVGVGLNVKFTMPLLAPVVAILLLYRAFVPATWDDRLRFRLRRRETGTTSPPRVSRLGLALRIIALMAVVGYLSIWACYGFRFSAARDADEMLNTDRYVQESAVYELFKRDSSHPPTMAEIEAWEPSPSVVGAIWLLEHRVLPEAWVAGVMFAGARAGLRAGFLLDQYSATGWWYYFPLAMFFKTPVATLLAMLAAIVVLVGRRLRSFSWMGLWPILCVALPVIVYLAAAMSSNLNIGVRHLLPIFPLLFIATGAAAARAFERWRLITIVVMIVVGAGLFAETLSASPNFIAFFNVASGGTRNSIHLLGDSNLDWGQDLPLLAKWQRDHPDRELYLNYFGTADPAFYGIRYHNLPGGYRFGPEPQQPGPDAVVAFGATQLQGVHLPAGQRPQYARYRAMKPTEILGGTIYLFDLAREPK